MEEVINKSDNQFKDILNDLIDYTKDSQEKSALIEEVCRTKHSTKPAASLNSSTYSSAASSSSSTSSASDSSTNSASSSSTSSTLSSPSQSSQTNGDNTSKRSTLLNNVYDKIQVAKMEDLGKTARILEHRLALSSEHRTAANGTGLIATSSHSDTRSISQQNISPRLSSSLISQTQEDKSTQEQQRYNIVKAKDSLLTTSSGYTNYRGILNLVIILLVLSNARAALENIIKYGILVDPLSWLLFFGEGSKHWPALWVILNLGTHILTSLLIEKYIAYLHQHSKISTASVSKALVVANAAIVINLFACISLPPIVIYLNDTHPISTSGSLMIVSIVFLKLVSYHMVNFWCRDMQRDKKIQSKTTTSFLRTCSSLCQLAKYPKNISLGDMCWYMLFPTLCYELEFLRTERLRKRFLIKRIVELLILIQLDIALVQQWLVPTVSNSVVPFRQMQFSNMLERLLKLAIPNHVIWLIWFYLFFHSLLNIIAELTRFADREFYRDWWNSESVYYFWSNWNIPVHKWCARHLYIPLIALGLNKCQASTAVFFVSAFFHEYLVSVPLKMFRIWAFTGMLIQLPWARFVSAYFNNHFANVAVWVSLIIGQPLCILMYYHDYYVITRQL